MFFALVFASWVILTFNQLVRQRNKVREATGDIDVQLKRRSNLVPNLVECVKGYASHESETLTQIARHRTTIEQSEGITATGRSTAETGLTDQLRHLFALVEDYPNLKADQNFLRLQEELGDIEDKIEHARRYYNGAVRNLNNLIECFPSNIIALYFGFRPASFFQVETAIVRESPKVDMK
jgi:LemA protein